MNAPFPHALTLAPSSILASTITRSGEIEVSRYPARDGFIAYFNDALGHHGKQPEYRESPDTHNEEDAITIIRDAAEDTSQGLSETLGYKPEFTVLFLPSVFNMSTKNAASKAMFPNGRLSKDGPKHIGYVPSAAGYAYRLGQCESLSLTPDECENIDLSLVLVIEYEKDYLYLHIVGVYSKWGEFPPVEKKFAKEFGEQSGNTLRDKIGIKEYDVKLNNFFTDFIKGVMNTSYASYKKEDIKAIVGVGGASSLAFTKILEIARNAVDNRKAKVFDYIDLSLVVAHGAAMYARDTVLRRDLWGYHYDDEFQYVHDEL